MRRSLGISIAGGGFMGIGPAALLAKLEAETAPLAPRIAWGAGTSVGAVDIAFLAAGFPSADLLGMYRADLAPIFGTKLWRYRLLRCGPQYEDGPVVKILKTYLGNRTMADTMFPIYLTSWDVRSRQIKVFGPQDHDVPLWYAVRCSMAAPSFFAPMPGYTTDGGVFRIVPGLRYEDGGMAANDPSLVGLAGAVWDGVIGSHDDIRVLDLSTSGTTPEGPAIPPNRFIASVLTEEVLPCITAGNSADVAFIIRAWAKTMIDLGGSLQTYRVSPDTPDYKLDQTEHAPEVVAIWEKAWDAHGDALKLFTSPT